MLGAMLVVQGGPGESIYPPDGVLQGPPFANKQAMEFTHLQHFKKSVKAHIPELQFRMIGMGDDPPDFLLHRNGVQFGLELTVFASPERRERASFISKIHDRLLDVYKSGRLQGLSGMRIDLAFGSLGGKPFQIDDALFNQLVDAWDDLGKLERPSMDIDVDIPSGEWPTGTVGALEWWVSSYSTQRMSGSKFANITGFEVEYTHREFSAVLDVAGSLSDIIKSKDHPAVDELLIVAGGPDRNGRRYIAESMTAIHLLEGRKYTFDKPTHIKRVFVDVWGPDRAYLIYDGTGVKP